MDKITKIIVEKIERALEKKEGPILVAIGGNGGTGKTTLSLMLKEALGEKRVNLLNVDGYYKEISYRRKMDWTGGNPKAVKEEKMHEALQNIKEGKTFEPALETVNNEQHLYQKVFVPKEINIVDGLITLMKPYIGYADVKILIFCPDELQLKRRLDRDLNARNRPLQDIKEMFEKRNKDAKKYIYAQEEECDVVLESEENGFKLLRKKE